MSTLAQGNEKSFRRYLASGALCLLFAVVYEAFSHGVWSVWMLTMPLHPLLSAFLFYILEERWVAVTDWFRSLWLCATVTRTLCACLRGVFDIYGTDFPFFLPLWLMGDVLLALALLAQWRAARR